MPFGCAAAGSYKHRCFEGYRSLLFAQHFCHGDCNAPCHLRNVRRLSNNRKMRHKRMMAPALATYSFPVGHFGLASIDDVSLASQLHSLCCFDTATMIWQIQRIGICTNTVSLEHHANLANGRPKNRTRICITPRDKNDDHGTIFSPVKLCARHPEAYLLTMQTAVPYAAMRVHQFDCMFAVLLCSHRYTQRSQNLEKV